MIKNETYKGFSTFLKALHKHINAGTFGGFWTEINGKKSALVANDYVLAGKSKRYVYMHELVNDVIAQAGEVSEQEITEVISRVVRYSYLFESKYFFLIETKLNVVKEATIEAEQTTDESGTDSPAVQFSAKVEYTGEDLIGLDIKALRKVYEDTAGKKPAMAMKETKLIEKIVEMRNGAE
jgi:hypothetical protein